MKNSFSFSRYRLLKSKNSVGQILGFHRFPKKYCWAIFVCDVTDDLFSQCEADLHTEPRILFPQSRAPRKLILKIFTEYFVVCPVELQGINNMLICPILSPYLSGPWLPVILDSTNLQPVITMFIIMCKLPKLNLHTHAGFKCPSLERTDEIVCKHICNATLNLAMLTTMMQH